MNLCELLFKVSDITSQIAVILDNFNMKFPKCLVLVYAAWCILSKVLIMHNSTSL